MDAIKSGELPVTPVAEIPDPSKDVDADESLTQTSVQEGPVTEVEKIKLPNTSEDIDADKSIFRNFGHGHFSKNEFSSKTRFLGY